MRPIINDKLGQEIKAGEYVIYRRAGKSTFGLDVGKVIRTDFERDYLGQYIQDSNGNLFPVVHVRGVTERNNFAQLNKRNSRLTVVANIVLYPQMPQIVKDLFTSAGL